MSNADLNLFERYAENTKPRFVRRRERATAKRRQTLKSKMIEQSQLERQYKALSAERRAELLEGPYSFEFRGLLSWLDEMTLRDGAALVAFVQALNWLRKAPKPVRQEALILISRAIIRLRERHRMPPFDDGLPWEAPTAFVRVRELLEEGTDAQGGDDRLCEGDREGMEPQPERDDRGLGDRPMRAAGLVPQEADAA